MGKTWALTEFGKTSYANIAYFNFDLNPEYHQFFQTTKDPKRIIENLSAASAQPIFPDKTLLIFDEIQACPESIASLKYFYEFAPEYHVACAGSLLGIALSHPASYPVGKVNVLDMYPLVFEEFLVANNDDHLVEYLKNYNWSNLQALEKIPDAIFNPLLEKLKIYLVVGGMPEAVMSWVESRDMNEVDAVLYDLIQLYSLDFQKHSSQALFPKIQLVWNSIPAQLARENKKFLYSLLKESARGREYEDAVQWLVNASLLTRVTRSSKPGLPLSAYDEIKAFKLYLLDVGLLRRFSNLAPSAITEGSRLFTEFKGALSENYALQEIAMHLKQNPRYWATDNPHYEVDFLVQWENTIVPIEVKAGENIKAKSLRKYRKNYPKQTPIAIRISLNNISFDNGLLSLPLFMLSELPQALSAANLS